MRTRANLEVGPLLALVGGVVLLVSLFLHWYTPGISAWNAFEVIDLLLALAALGAIFVSLRILQPNILPAVRARIDDGAILAAGVIALVLVASQLINRPPAASGSGIMFGGWLGLGGAALIVAGGIATAAWGVSLRVTVDRKPQRPPPPPPPPAPPRPPGRGSTSETRELP